MRVARQKSMGGRTMRVGRGARLPGLLLCTCPAAARRAPARRRTHARHCVGPSVPALCRADEYDLAADEEIEAFYFSSAAGRARVVLENRRFGAGVSA